MKRVVRLAIPAVTIAVVVAGSAPSGSGSPAGLALAEALGDPLNPAVWIEGGTVLTGSDDWNLDAHARSNPYSRVDEDPGRWALQGFWIQEHEVTNEEYARFDPTHAYGPSLRKRPVTGVTWGEAMAYARFLGGTLPSEVHWEYVARGAERREYPWGDAAPSCDLAHYRDCGRPSTLDAKALPLDVTPEGVYDLAGNVREWVTPIWFDPDRHPENVEIRRLKGGSFAHPAFFLRPASVTNDFAAHDRWDYVGFRVAWLWTQGDDRD